MLSIDFNSIVQDRYLRITLDGEFSNDNVGKLFDRILLEIDDKGKFNIIFDMSKVESINSSAAGGFARIFEEMDVRGGRVYMTNMNAFVEDTLDLLGMFLFLNRSKTLEEAILDINS